MAEITIESIFALMTKNKLDPTTDVEFSVGDARVNPKDVVAVVRGGGGYNSRKQYVEVQLSTDFIDGLVRRRMKEMYSEHIDAMFTKEKES